jgi:hypothetical protein
MSLSHTQIEILEHYSTGHLSWRKAAEQLSLSGYPELEALMIVANIPFYTPNREKEQAALTTALEVLTPHLKKG